MAKIFLIQRTKSAVFFFRSNTLYELLSIVCVFIYLFTCGTQSYLQDCLTPRVRKEQAEKQQFVSAFDVSIE